MDKYVISWDVAWASREALLYRIDQALNGKYLSHLMSERRVPSRSFLEWLEDTTNAALELTRKLNRPLSAKPRKSR